MKDKFKNKLNNLRKKTIKKIVPKDIIKPEELDYKSNPMLYKSIDLKRNANCFNCSIIKHNDIIHLVYRKGDGPVNYTEIVKLDKNYNLIDNTRERICPHSSEDPRIWKYKDELYCSFTHVRGRQKYNPIEIVRLKDKKLFTINFDGCPYHRVEKNWCFFQYGEHIYCSYEFDPIHIILRFRIDEANSQFVVIQRIKSAGISWHVDRISGGGPPILYEGKYWSFFHGKVGGRWDRIYSMGLYSFEPDPPFRALSISKEPILIGAPWGGRTHRRHRVVFPGGAYIEDGVWTIAFGYNDLHTFIIKRNHEDLVSDMRCI